MTTSQWSMPRQNHNQVNQWAENQSKRTTTIKYSNVYTVLDWKTQVHVIKETILLMLNSKSITYSMPVMPNSLAIDTNPEIWWLWALIPLHKMAWQCQSWLSRSTSLSTSSVRPIFHLTNSSDEHLTGLILLALRIFIVPHMICLSLLQSIKLALMDYLIFPHLYITGVEW